MPDDLSAAELAAHFESLGGGRLSPNDWAFGSEFGSFQRHVSMEPMDLLRWAGIRSESILKALHAGFAGVAGTP